MVTEIKKIVVGDLSQLPRVGVKGSNAAAWLQEQGVTLPEAANSWTLSESGILVLRLGLSEFLIEDQANGKQGDEKLVDTLKSKLKTSTQGIYPVARADASFALSGDDCMMLLSEICLLDLQQDTHQNALFLTQIAGISATVLKQSKDNQPFYRIWCDGTYHRYMHETLTTIAKELGDKYLGDLEPALISTE